MRDILKERMRHYIHEKSYLTVQCTLCDTIGRKSSDSMFTSAKIRNGSTYLDNHLSANDYYAKGERVKGEWVGKGAESLGLIRRSSPGGL